MKKLHRVIKLLTPGCLVGLWLNKKYGIKNKSVSDSAAVRCLTAILPYAVSAILQQRVETDRRVVKYFLPYGIMCRHMMRAYGKNVRSKEHDKGLGAVLRSMLPYGLVLWWDGENVRPLPKEQGNKRSAVDVKRSVAEPDAEQQKFFQQTRERQDRLEVLSMRALAGGKSPSVTVVITGKPAVMNLADTLERLNRCSLYEIEVIVAVPDAGAGLAEVGRMRHGVSAVAMEPHGRALHEIRNAALGVARGDYVAFIEVGDHYATPYMLEMCVLSAKVEGAEMCGGQTTINWKAWRDGISGKVFDRAWLLASGLEFVSDDKANDGLFLDCVEALAGRVQGIPRGVVNHVPAQDDVCFTAQERREDLLMALVRASRLVDKVQDGDRLAKALMHNLETAKSTLRAIVWPRAALDEKKMELVHELARNLGWPELGEEFARPLVSVIVPAYNVERCLPRCLDSLVAQTLNAVEIIVVDDGATDSTPAIADKYAAEWPQVKAVHRTNGGLSAARNSGVKEATGKYIGFVDGDDWVDSEMFESMVDLLENDDNAELAVCGAKVEFAYEVSEKDAAHAQKYFDLPKAGGYDLTCASVHDLNSSVCTKLYRRSFLDEYRIRFPEGMDNEDEVFFFFTMGKAHRVQIVGRPFYHYIRNQSGIMAQQGAAFDATGTLPDSLKKAFPLVAAYLKEDDRRDLLGVFYRHLCGVASRYQGDVPRARIAQLLHETGFFYNREFLDTRDLGWVDNQLKFCHNYDFSKMPALEPDAALFPLLRPHIKACDEPSLTFIVPVYNQERYFTFCIESLRRQTLSDIEIVCVDDGSTDHSWRLMEEYAAIDGRVRIFHQANHGVSAARNFALKQARGRYVAFVDGDDYVEPTMAERLVAKMDHDRLDVCPIDFVCFDYRTHAPVNHYWALRNHRSAFPTSPVFSFEDLASEIAFFGGAAGSVWSRDFLVRNGLEFPSLVNNEDLMFSIKAWVMARRMGVAMTPYYHYRRGNPSSAVSNRASGAGDVTVISSLREMARFLEYVRGSCTGHVVELVVKRILVELVYYGNTRPNVLAFLQNEGFDLFGFDRFRPMEPAPEIWQRYDQLRGQPEVSCVDGSSLAKAKELMPKGIRNAVERIERGRTTSRKDLYIITGQLNSSENAPIDSWTFFRWLQAHGVPSRYVMWKKHWMYGELKRKGELKDVILLDGDGCMNFEFIEKCEDALVRCKMVAQENGALNSWVRVWLYYLPDCQYTFLEHGIKFWKYTATMGRYFATFNVINNSSMFEKNLLESNLPGHYETDDKPNCIVGGLPRLDLVKDEREAGRTERIVFVMFTWRTTFNSGQAVLEKSAYYHGLRALMSEENLRRLKSLGVKFVLSAHHHLVNRVKHLSFGDTVKIVPQDEVAYWKGHADCCLTDYSSIAFDYLFLGKPVVYWVPDREDALLVPEDYNEIVEAERRSRYIFNVVDSATAVIDMIEHYAKNGFTLETEKGKIADKFFAHRSDFCRHLYEALENVAPDVPSAAQS